MSWAISSKVFDLTTDRVQYFRAMEWTYKHLDCGKLDSAGQAVQAIRYIVNKFVRKVLDYM